MLNEFYKLGALQACIDAGITKQALLSELVHNVPAVAKSFAKTKAIGQLKGGMREALGVPTPEWREAGGLYEIPELAAKNLQREVQEVLAPEPEPIKLPVIQFKLPPKVMEPAPAN